MPLLQTKLYVPPPRPNLVQRGHLLDRLRKEGARRLTLISAPAGFGKTTLVSAWVAQTVQAAAWLALDADDNDFSSFLTYLVAALQTRRPNLGATVLGLLDAPQAQPYKTILTLLINELDAVVTPLTLILDDYHVIDAPPIHEAMAFFIDHLPPHLHLVITSRIDPPLPLARWRARNQLTELRADDLRFRSDEAAMFLNEIMGLQLSAADIAALEMRTEGWITGLQLAALSLQGREDRSGFIQTFSGSHRHVLSYLLEEVLNRQPDDTKNFLIQTAILDRLCGSLCEAVTGQADGFATLMRLEQANLFLVSLDDEGRWYRYHHLFRQVLYARLQQTQAGAMATLHRRASAWCEQHNLLDQAMHHALVIPELELASSLLECHALTLLMQSELMLLRKWVAQLPGELIQRRPRLALAQGWVLVMLGQLASADEALKAPALQAADLPADLAGELALLRADIAGFRRDPSALDWAMQALDLLPLDREALRVIALNEIGLAYMRRGELVTASHTLQQVATRAEAVENRFVALDAFAALHLIQVRQGRLFKAIQTCEQALRIVARWAGPIPPATGMIYVGLGGVLCEWNELDRADQALRQGLQLLQGTIEKMPLVRGHVARARVHQAQGDPAGALASLTQAEAWFANLQIQDSLAMNLLDVQRARLWIRLGDLDAAHRWASESSLPADTEVACEHWLTLARLHLAQYRRTPDSTLLNDASMALAAVRTRVEAEDWPVYCLEERMIQALILYAQNNLPDAFAVLLDVLILAEPGGYVRLFLDEGEPLCSLMFDCSVWLAKQMPVENHSSVATYVDKLLAAFPIHEQLADQTEIVVQPSLPNPKSKIQKLVEPLSSRELEVLQLIAAGLSNGEIAGRLVVTVGTVKSHVNHLFSKLGVTSRTRAIACARSLGLLAD
jgi:LuxR family maltose regulon positive regulatory protein